MQANLEATLAKLISIPSVSNNPVACRDIITFVNDELEPYGLFVQSKLDIANPWLLATTKDTKTPDILLAAHLDVVPATDDMFTMQKQDGKLYGRGVFDMKFAAACYLEFIKNHSAALSGLNIGLLFTTDEEIASPTMPSVLATGLRPKAVFLPDGGDDWAIEKRAKGFYAVELIARGKASHSSRPWEGKSALHTLMDALQLLRAKYPLQEKNGATLMVNAIHGGEAVNQIPDYAAAKVDLRTFSAQDIQDCQQFIEHLAQTHDLKINPIHKGDPLIFDEHAPAVQSFLKAFKEHLNVSEVPYTESYGGTDGRFFAEHGIPCIILDPHGGGRHADNEWMQANDLESYYQLIERWLIGTQK